MDAIHNSIGIAGSALIIVAYLLLQMERLTSSSVVYSMMNLCGATGIIISLYFEPNMPALIIEIFWVLISLIGIYRWILKSKKPATSDDGFG